MEWSTFVLQPQWLSRLDRLALKRFNRQGLAEEAAAYVIEQLSRDNWSVCAGYSGKAKPETYLLTLTSHFLEEFSRKRFGRLRPPEWLKREDGIWLKLWQLICLERQPHTQIIDIFTAKGHQYDFVKAVVTTIKARIPSCGNSNREIGECCSQVDDEDDHSYEQASHTLEHQLLQHEMEDVLLLIHQLFELPGSPSTETDHNAAHTMNTNQTAWQRINDHLVLSGEERLLLKMVYQEGMKMNVVAAALNMPAYQPGRLLKGIHARIQNAFTKAGINLAANANNMQELADE